MLRIFGPKREKVMGGWRKLHNEELHNLYSSPEIVKVIKSRRIRWLGHVAVTGKMRDSYKVLVGKAEQERPPGRSRHRWEDNIRMDLRDWYCVDWILLAQDRDQWWAVTNIVINFWVP
jgi:hypothetical protein